MMIWMKKAALLPCNLDKVRTFKAEDDDDDDDYDSGDCPRCVMSS